MPRLSDSQFSDYEFRAHRTQYAQEHGAETTVVVAHKGEYGGETRHRAVGSMVITQDDLSSNDYKQSLINRGFVEHSHTVGEMPGGQRTWAGGAFTPVPSRVSWLGMTKDAPKTLLKGMMGLGVAMHGSTPVADYDLSQHGAKIAQGAARKYGVKPHPNNPNMSSTFSYDFESRDVGRNAEEAAGQVAVNTWRNSNYGSIGRMGNEWRSFTPTEVGHLTRGVEEQLGRKKADPRIPVHPSQGKLF